jgi:hypothetical protein
MRACRSRSYRNHREPVSAGGEKPESLLDAIIGKAVEAARLWPAHHKDLETPDTDHRQTLLGGVRRQAGLHPWPGCQEGDV